MAELQTVTNGTYDEPYNRPYNREVHERSSRPYTRDDYMKDSLLFNSGGIETTKASIDPDTGVLRQPWYLKHKDTLGKIFLVVFFSSAGIGLYLWYQCALCGQVLHLLPSDPVQSLNTTAQPVCLDGSPAGYYLDVGDDPTRWVIWLAGGGICEDLSECQYRAKDALGSSKFWPKRRRASATHGGDEILSNFEDGNKGFASWSKVYIPYCSGDAWLGHQQGEFDPWGQNKGVGKLHFAGHTIVAAVIKELLKEPLRIDTAKTVLLSGTSHGGYGTFMHVDWLQQQLPQVDVRGNPQAGWFGAPIENWVSHFQRTTDPDPTHFARMSWIFNLENYFKPPQVTECLADAQRGALRLPESFSAYYPAVNDDEPLKACITAPVVYNYTKAPMFISENSADMYQVLIVEKGDGSDHDYVQFVRKHIIASLTTSSIHASSKKKDGMFVPACKAHCLQYDAAIELSNHCCCHDATVGETHQGNDAPLIQGYTHSQAIAGWIKDERGIGHDTPGGPWKLLDDASNEKTLEKCETHSGPLLAVCLIPTLTRSLIS